MCKGLGLDLCEIARMETLLADERFLSRYFTPEEAAYVRSQRSERCADAGGVICRQGSGGQGAGCWSVTSIQRN